MTQVEIPNAARAATGGYKVDVTRGERNGRVSSEWFSRPDDERFLSLSELMAAVKGRTERSRTRTVDSASTRVEAGRDDAERLAFILPGSDSPIAPTHWSFGQLAGLVGAPAAYLRQLPAPLTGINLQYGLASHRTEQVKTLEIDSGRVELRAVTGPDYGRIYDHELVAAVQKIAGDGTGDTRWKIPGVLDWASGVYNPRVDVTRDTTTLYASDRDVFLFLVLQLRMSPCSIMSDDRRRLMSASPQGPSENAHAIGCRGEEEARDQTADFRYGWKERGEIDQTPSDGSGLVLFGLLQVDRRKSAANLARNAAAAMHKVMWRFHPCQDRASQWSRPTSRLAR